MHPLAQTRITRLAVGVTLALFVSQALGWPAGYLSPVLVSVLLAQPLSAPGIKVFVGFVLLLTGSLLIGVLIDPLVRTIPLAGSLLMFLLLFLVFRFAVSGGAPLLATFLSMGIAVVPVMGSSNPKVAMLLLQALGAAAVTAAVFTWLAHRLIPDPITFSASPPPATKHDHSSWSATLALRSLFVVAPLMLLLMASGNAHSYAPVLIKSMALGQQVATDQRRQAAHELVLSTTLGGIGALLIWSVLKIWPSLLIYTLLVFTFSLVMGRGIFQGEQAHPRASMWSYALMTCLVVLGPTVSAGEGGDPALGAMLTRILLMILASLYAAGTVWLFNRWVLRGRLCETAADHNTALTASAR